MTSIIDPPWEDQCEWHRMTRMTGPDCAVMCNLINTHTHTHTHTHTRTHAHTNKYRGSFPATYSLLPLAMSPCGEVGSDVHALIKELAINQTGRAQVGDTLLRVPTSGGRDGSSTSSAVIFLSLPAGTFTPHALPSLHTGGGGLLASDSSVIKVQCLCTRIVRRG